MNAHTTADLVQRLRASANEVESFPHPSHCDHLHSAFKVMREAADSIEAAVRERLADEASRARDAERLDWLESRYADGVHVEVFASGSATWHGLRPTTTIYVGHEQWSGNGSLRDAIDAARRAIDSREGV